MPSEYQGRRQGGSGGSAEPKGGFKGAVKGAIAPTFCQNLDR